MRNPPKSASIWPPRNAKARCIAAAGFFDDNQPVRCLTGWAWLLGTATGSQGDTNQAQAHQGVGGGLRDDWRDGRRSQDV
jgi:hypothetical protein